MPISKYAVEQFLAKKSEPKLNVRGKDHAWLHDIIIKATGKPLRQKFKGNHNDQSQRQLEAVAFALVVKQILLYYGMRTGKTRISLEWLEHLINTVGWISKALIIPHAPVGVDEWERQTPIYSDLNLSFIRSGKQSINSFLDAVDNPNVNGVCLTWPTLQQIFTEKKEVKIKDKDEYRNKYVADRQALRIAAPLFQATVIDEIHGINDTNSLRFNMISELAPELLDINGWRMGMTGTPFGRDPLGLWSQSRIIDGGRTLGSTYYFFQEAFGHKVRNPFTASGFEIEFDQRKLPILRAKLEHRILECRLEDIQDVNVVANQLVLSMSKQQKKAYNELIDDMVKVEGDIKKKENIFVRLRQVSSGFRPFIDDDGEARIVEFPDAAKFTWLEDFLSDPPDMKIVFFHEFIATGRRISRILERKKLKYRWLWGGSKDKKGDIHEFQYGKAQFLVANAATGGVGTDMSAAEYMCIVESPTSVIIRQQMLARPLARGSRPLILDDMVCSQVEKRILDFHTQGKELMDAFRGMKAEDLRQK